MNFEVTSKNIDKIETNSIVIFTYADQPEQAERKMDKLTGGKLQELRNKKDFSGKMGQIKVLDTEEKFSKIILIGLGKKETQTGEKFRKTVSKAVKVLNKTPEDEVVINIPKINKTNTQTVAQIFSETAIMSAYTFTKYKTKKTKQNKLKKFTLLVNTGKDVTPAKRGLEVGEAIGKSISLARDLGNLPANDATPGHLSKIAEQMARDKKNLKVTVFGKKEIEKEKMGAFLAVAQGTAEEPKFIIFEHKARTNSGKVKATAPTIALVGKGITFDSGGISLKPSEKMEEMKFDMAGAATVFGVIKAASEINLPINIIGLVAATENLPSSRAMKPGDIITSRSGKTIEIINTDAEGRLILADALDYAKKFNPELVVDFATLTGAIVVALGDEQIGAFSNNDQATKQIVKASTNSDEHLTMMPLEKEYRSYLTSSFADLRNLSTNPYGGAITAALFLQEFVNFPWVHLDIAGVAWATRDKPYRPKGATGAGIRLMVEFLKNYKKIK